MNTISDKDLVEILPPEAVTLRFERSSFGTRFAAQLVDVLITYLSLFALLLAIIFIFRILNEGVFTFVILLSFFIRSPYYIFTELVWNGQTIGKKLSKICVVSADGKTLTPYQVVVRNLMKEAEVFFPISMLFGVISSSGTVKLICFFWLCVTLIYPLRSKYNQRLGDVIAGTFVVEKPKIVFLEDVAERRTKRAQFFDFDPEQLDSYGRFELQTLEDIIRAPEKTKEARERKLRAAKAIHKKIGYPHTIPLGKEILFLEDFYVQQRQYLESKNLFGDLRENKHYKE